MENETLALQANKCKNQNESSGNHSKEDLLSSEDFNELCRVLTVNFGKDYSDPSGSYNQKARLIFQMAIKKKFTSADLQKTTQLFIDNQIYPEWTAGEFFYFDTVEKKANPVVTGKTILRQKMEMIPHDSLIQTPDGKVWHKVANGFYLDEPEKTCNNIFAPFCDFETKGHYTNWLIIGEKKYD